MSGTWVPLMWLPGTLLGVGLGALGSYIGVQASRGRLRPGAVRLMAAALAVSAAFALAGLVALAAGQPRVVWYGLLLPGLIGAALLGANLPVVRRLLREQSGANPRGRA